MVVEGGEKGCRISTPHIFISPLSPYATVSEMVHHSYRIHVCDVDVHTLYYVLLFLVLKRKSLRGEKRHK